MRVRESTRARERERERERERNRAREDETGERKWHTQACAHECEWLVDGESNYTATMVRV